MDKKLFFRGKYHCSLPVSNVLKHYFSSPAPHVIAPILYKTMLKLLSLISRPSVVWHQMTFSATFFTNLWHKFFFFFWSHLDLFPLYFYFIYFILGGYFQSEDLSVLISRIFSITIWNIVCLLFVHIFGLSVR